MWTKDHKWPVGGDLCMDPIDSSWERPDVFKFGLPDHFGKAQAPPNPDSLPPGEEINIGLFAALNFSLWDKAELKRTL